MKTEPLRPSVGRWSVRMLGGFSADNGSTRITHFASRALTLLFARLVLMPGTAHEREQLAEWIWPLPGNLRVGDEADAERSRRARLRRALFDLRALLELPSQPPAIIVQGQTLRLNPGAFRLDTEELLAHVRKGDAGSARQCYRGELLPGLREPWIDEHRQRLAGLLNRLDGGTLDDEIADFGPSAEAAALPRFLIPYVSTFFGRQAEVARLHEALEVHRCVVVSGPGGSGKTRLATEVLLKAPGFDPVQTVPLLDCPRPELIVETIGRALGMQPSPQQAASQLLARLHGRRALLLLDDFEHLADADGAGVLANLLQQLPQLHVLVTSRRALAHDEVLSFELSPLPLPQPGMDRAAALSNPCVALFLDRARTVDARFHLHSRNLGSVIDLCRLLDGMPLAIELAASWARKQTPHQMASSLARTGRIAGEQGAGKVRAGRHGSLDTVLQWSWDLLDPPSRDLLADLAVLEGAWSAEQAQSVARPGLDASLSMHALVAHSLLLAHRHTADDGSPAGLAPVRYRLALVVRGFLATKADADLAMSARAAQARRRHRRYFQARAAQLAGRHEPAADADLPNHLAAIRHALDVGDATAAIDHALALGSHFSARGASADAQDLLCALLDRSTGSSAPRLALAALVPRLLVNAGRTPQALERAAAGVTLAGAEPTGQAEAHFTDTLVRWMADRDGARALAPAQQALRLAEHAGLPATRARALLLLGAITLTHLEDADEAIRLFKQAQRAFAALSDRRGALLAIPGLAACLLIKRRSGAAVRLSAAAERRSERLGDVITQLQLCSRQAVGLEAMRQFEASLAVSRRITHLAAAQGLRYHVAYGLWNQGRPLARLHQPELAARLMAFSQRFWAEQFGRLDDADLRTIRRVRGLVAVQVGEARLQALWAEGLALSEQQAIALGSRGPDPADDLGAHENRTFVGRS